MTEQDRKKQNALWEARDGIAMFTLAMEKLHMDHRVKGTENLWDEGLKLWSAFSKVDMVEMEARLEKRRKGDRS